MRRWRNHSKLASLLLIVTLILAAGCTDDELPGFPSTGGGRGGNKNASPSPSPTPTPDGSGGIETPPPSAPPTATPVSLAIVPGAHTVSSATGGGVQLGVQIGMSNGTTNTNPTDATWTSSDSSRASVSNGWVTVPVNASAGTVTITATAKGSSVSGTATITITASQVTPTAQKVEITPSSHSFESATGGTTLLSALVTMSDNSKHSNVTWTSSDPSRATVANGTVTVAPGASAGTVTITATAAGSSVAGTATITITEKPAATVTAVSVTSNKFDISVGPEGNTSAAQLMTQLTMSDGSKVYSSDVDWTSSHPTVAYVSSASQVQVPAGVTPGTYSVTFTAKAKNTAISGSVTMTITIVKTVTGIAIAPPSSSTLFAGATLQLVATKTMSDNSTETSGVTWTTSNPNLAEVSNGLVSVPGNLVGEGTVTITASAGGRSASIILTVKPAPSVSSIAVTPKTVTINAAPASGTPASGFVTSAQLTVTATMTDGTSMPFTNVNWTSVDTRSLQVSSTGVVTAPSTAVPGTYRVTAQVKGSSISGWADVTVKTDGRVNIIVQ